MTQFEQATQQQTQQAQPAQSGGDIAASQTQIPQSSQAASSATQAKPEVHINSDEISAVLAQALGTAGTAGLTPDSNIGSAAPTIKDQQVSFDGDLVHGQFLTEDRGQRCMDHRSPATSANKDGYATFDPTEFKVGDLNVPVSLVNPALQKKLSEERDRLKLPDNVGGVKVENGELVMQGK